MQLYTIITVTFDLASSILYSPSLFTEIILLVVNYMVVHSFSSGILKNLCCPLENVYLDVAGW